MLTPATQPHHVPVDEAEWRLGLDAHGGHGTARPGPTTTTSRASPPILCRHKIGTLCLLDTRPRPALTGEQQRTLRDLARLVADRLELRRLGLVERMAASIVETTSDAVVCADGRGAIVSWNKAAEALFGYPREEAVGRAAVSPACGSMARLHQQRRQFCASANRSRSSRPSGIVPRATSLDARALRRTSATCHATSRSNASPCR